MKLLDFQIAKIFVGPILVRAEILFYSEIGGITWN